MLEIAKGFDDVVIQLQIAVVINERSHKPGCMRPEGRVREAEELVYASGDLDTPVQHDFVTLEDLLVVDLGVKPEVGAIFVTELYSHKTICMFTMVW